MDLRHSTLLKSISAFNLSKLAASTAASKSGYLCRMQSRKVAHPFGSIDEPYFSVHWAVLHEGHLFLFDSSISRTCSEVIRLRTWRLEPALNPDRSLWPSFCEQSFRLTASSRSGGDGGSNSWQFGCNSDVNWLQHLRAAAASNSDGGSWRSSASDDAAALRSIVEAAAGKREAGADVNPEASRQPPERSSYPPSGSNPYLEDSTYDSIVPQLPTPIGNENNHLDTADNAASPPVVATSPPQANQEARLSMVYDYCVTETRESLHSLALSGRMANLAIDYVASAVYPDADADEGCLWQMLEDTEPGTFLLTGFSKEQPNHGTQIAVKTNGLEVKFLPISRSEGTGAVTLQCDDRGGTFESIEQLVFHYHLFPIVKDASLCLTCSYGYDAKETKIPAMTMLLTACFWTLGDKDLCSRVLYDSAVGTYSLRTSGGPSSSLTSKRLTLPVGKSAKHTVQSAQPQNGYVLSVLSHGIVAKLVVKAVEENDLTQFYIQNGGAGSGATRYNSLEELLVCLHRTSFPILMNKKALAMTLQTPLLISNASKSRLQALLLSPLRQRIFHRGSEQLAQMALGQPGVACGSFIVWLCSASDLFLLVRSRGRRVFRFPIVCIDTGCRHLPASLYHLERNPSLRFDTIEALVAHLQWNADLLAPEIQGPLTQPVCCRQI